MRLQRNRSPSRLPPWPTWRRRRSAPMQSALRRPALRWTKLSRRRGDSLRAQKMQRRWQRPSLGGRARRRGRQVCPSTTAASFSSRGRRKWAALLRPPRRALTSAARKWLRSMRPWRHLLRSAQGQGPSPPLPPPLRPLSSGRAVRVRQSRASSLPPSLLGAGADVPSISSSLWRTISIEEFSRSTGSCVHFSANFIITARLYFTSVPFLRR
mmetsp:Transcript_28786/g.91914  ORF Transcript_28786/g.91914 Transcript_28786/m.91914 type:complete len:212 (-) Transcript_28786:255-890(-)